jgi:hypothetical protein
MYRHYHRCALLSELGGPKGDEIGIVHRRDQYAGPLAAEICGQRSQAPEYARSVEIDQPNRWGELVEEGSFGGSKDEVHLQPPLGDTLGQVDDHSLGTAAVEGRQEEGNGLAP